MEGITTLLSIQLNTVVATSCCGEFCDSNGRKSKYRKNKRSYFSRVLKGWTKGLYTNKVFYQESTGIALGKVYESSGVAVVVATGHYWKVFCLVYTKSSLKKSE